MLKLHYAGGSLGQYYSTCEGTVKVKWPSLSQEVTRAKRPVCARGRKRKNALLVLDVAVEWHEPGVNEVDC